MVLKKLYSIDHVAYIRFASVYRNFENLEGFISEIRTLSDRDPEALPSPGSDLSGEGT